MYLEPSMTFNLNYDNAVQVFRSVASRLRSEAAIRSLEQLDATHHAGLDFETAKAKLNYIETAFNKPSSAKKYRDAFNAAVKETFLDEMKIVRECCRDQEEFANMSFEMVRKQGSPDLELFSIVLSAFSYRCEDTEMSSWSSKVATYFERAKAFNGLASIKLGYTSKFTGIKFDAFGIDDNYKTSRPPVKNKMDELTRLVYDAVSVEVVEYIDSLGKLQDKEMVLRAVKEHFK